MRKIDQTVEMLVEDIRASQTYKDYKRCEQILKQTPELYERANRYRAVNYNSLTTSEATGEDMIEVMERMTIESEELHRIPVVHDYLQAELAICRLLQKVTLDIVGGVAVNIPDLSQK